MTEEVAPGKLTNRQRVFIEAYLRCWNASEAARQAGYNGKSNVVGPQLLANISIKAAIRARLDAMQMETDEILVGLTQQARANLGVFFKIIEEWTFYPLPSYEVIDAKEVEITDNEGKPTGEKKISYWVRHIAVDMDKVIDPQYSHLLFEFSDSPKNGITIKIHSKQEAYKTLAKIRGLLKDQVDVNINAEIKGYKSVTPDDWDEP